MFRGRRGHQRGNFGVMMLALQLYNYGFDRIPPVTLVTILSQVAIFLGLGDLTRWFSSSYDVCISTHLVLRQAQWSRLILGTLYHGSDMHLYYNMISFLSKGVMLERKFRSVYFSYLLAVFTVLSSVTLVALNFALSQLFDDKSYELTCGVGFSGVLFALKVLAVHYSPAGRHYALGFIPVPSKYIYWVELGIIHLLVPNASFTGHLAGILVGLAYTKGPLKLLMDSVIPPEPLHRFGARNTGRDYGRGYTTGRATGHTSAYPSATGGPSAPPGEEVYNHPDRQNTDVYTAGLTEEEQIRRAMEESRRDQTGNTGSENNLYPDLDQLRQRRYDRYN